MCDIPHHCFPRGSRRDWEIAYGFIDPRAAGPSYLESREVLQAIIDAIPPGGLFLEIGSWTASTAAMIADARPEALIVTIDNFGRPSGQAEHCRWALAGVNVLSRPNVVQLVGDSAQADRLLMPMSADVVLVDGDHEEPGCYDDLVRGFGWSKNNGILFAHDFGIEFLPGVTAAVNRFCQDRRLSVVSRVQSLVRLA